MDDRELFATAKISDKNARILEIGPLNRPIFKKQEYPNCYYCDIRSTEEIKQLYFGNEYLKTTGISVDTSSIVSIDYVLDESYAETFAQVEKFDYVVMSHVMEHVEDILEFLNDICSVLKPNASLIVVYPDKRYCFDHYRQEASFRDAFEVYRKGYEASSRMVFDFLFNAVSQNSESFFWQAQEMEKYMPTNDFHVAESAYRRVQSGEREDDVHYWPFSDTGFLKFLYDCVRAGMLKFSCVDFIPTVENTQQFFLELRYDETVVNNPARELDNLQEWIATAPIDYFNSQRLRIEEQNKELKDNIEQLSQKNSNLQVAFKQQTGAFLLTINDLKQQIQSMDKKIELLQTEVESKQKENMLLQCHLNDTYVKLVEVEKSMQNILKSRSWRITAPIRRMLDLIKGVKK